MKRILPAVLILGMMTAQGYGESLTGESLPQENRSEKSLETLELQTLGHKQPDLPVPVRIRTLENRLNRRLPLGVSDEYRLAELYASQQAPLTAAQQNAAIQAYNQGIEATAAGRLPEAVRHYREALDNNPGMIQAANNLGNLLEQQADLESAIAVYRDALKHSPHEPLLHRNLGVIYEKTGRIQEALAEYETYLALSPEADPPIRSLVENYRANRQTTSPDYLSVINRMTQGRKLTWPLFLNPVYVHIRFNRPEQTAYLPVIREALGTWEEATSGRVRFREVAAPARANIMINLEEGPLAHPSQEVAHARYDIRQDRQERNHMMHVTITLKTGTDQDRDIPLETRQQQVQRFALHELGHAIGLWGHSTNPDDIMYTRPIASHLSERDIRTVRRLYDLK